ncbi:MAG: hypothetical protein AAF703_06055 [Cyanobacteria bacterium P01_D01_bin.105]
MSNSSPTDQLQATQPQSMAEVALAGAIALTKSKNYEQANQQFEALTAQLEADSPDASKLLKQLWKEYVAMQRSALFYERLSDAEAGLSEKMAENNIQLKRNYMRLIQEQ